MELYSKASPFVPDNLISGIAVPLMIKAVKLKKGQGVLKRGSVLGLITKAVGAIVPGDNTGDAEIAAALISDNVQAGSYLIVCSAKASGVAANDAVFSVFAPDGSRLADAVQGVEYAGGHLIFTIGNATADDSAIADSFTIAVADGSGLAVLVDKSKTDGSQNAKCILAIDTDTTDADIFQEVYVKGHLNRLALTVSAGDEIEDHEGQLESVGIYLSDNIAN